MIELNEVMLTLEILSSSTIGGDHSQFKRYIRENHRVCIDYSTLNHWAYYKVTSVAGYIIGGPWREIELNYWHEIVLDKKPNWKVEGF